MNEHFFLGILALVAVLWTIAGIAYLAFRTYLKYHSLLHRGEKNSSEKETLKKKPSENIPSILGKTKSDITRDFPELTAKASTDTPQKKPNNFADQKAEAPIDSGQISSDNQDETQEQENEMEVDYEADVPDEDEIFREQMQLAPDDSEVAPQSVLARDLGRLNLRQKKENALEEEDPAAFKQTVGKITGTKLMEAYKAHLLLQEEANRKLLELIREAEESEASPQEEKEEATDKGSTVQTQEKPLSFYL